MNSLLDNKKSCCGCGACVAVCPVNALEMVEDEFGFLYPKEDVKACIKCEKCKNLCIFKNEIKTSVAKSFYAAVIKSERILDSSSGGIFAALAHKTIKENGVVFGVAMMKIDGRFVTAHIGVEREEDLVYLQGTKYVQSDMSGVFENVEVFLNSGRKVLFSGTPCQIASLKSFLGFREYSELILVDIICHGVPSNAFFNEYISFLERKNKIEILDFIFRDKRKKGWAFISKMTYKDKRSKVKSKNIYAVESSYYYFFLKGYTYQDACYNCKFASKKRVGDITLGDFWGIEKEHPEHLRANGGEFKELNGISSVIVNTRKGENALGNIEKNIIIKPTEFEKIARWNGQLLLATKMSDEREKIFKLYSQKGYEAVDKYFYKLRGIRFYTNFLPNRFPPRFKKFLRRKVK